MVDVLVSSGTSATYQSILAVSGGTLDVKTQISPATPAHVRLQVIGPPASLPVALSSGTISFHSDAADPKHQALYSSTGTVASTLAFSGSDAVAVGSQNMFDVKWDGRDTFEQPNYDPTGSNWQNGSAKRLVLAGSYSVDAVASVMLGIGASMTVASSDSVSTPAYQLAVAQPHSGHYGDDWPRASVYKFIGHPTGGTISRSNLSCTGGADHKPVNTALAPMLLNYFDPEVYGVNGCFAMQFRFDSRTPAWFVSTTGFDPKRTKKDLPNAGTIDVMHIVTVSGGSGAIARSPTGTTTRAIAAVWNGGSWQMGWMDNPTFSSTSTRSYTPYTTGSGNVSVAPSGTVTLSFDGTNDPGTGAPYPDFTLQAPGTPTLSGSGQGAPETMLFVYAPVVASGGTPSYVFNPGGVAKLFVTATLDGLSGGQAIKCFAGYDPTVRQFTHVSAGTLGSFGVDENATTAGTAGYQATMRANVTPAVATADWQNTMALVTDDGHAGPGRIGFYVTTSMANCTQPGSDSYGELYEPDHDCRVGHSQVPFAGTRTALHFPILAATRCSTLTTCSWLLWRVATMPIRHLGRIHLVRRRRLRRRASTQLFRGRARPAKSTRFSRSTSFRRHTNRARHT